MRWFRKTLSKEEKKEKGRREEDGGLIMDSLNFAARDHKTEARYVKHRTGSTLKPLEPEVNVFREPWLEHYPFVHYDFLREFQKMDRKTAMSFVNLVQAKALLRSDSPAAQEAEDTQKLANESHRARAVQMLRAWADALEEKEL